MIKAYTFGQAKLAVDHFKAVVRDRVRNAITGIWIEGRERANDSAFGVFVHRCTIQRKVAWTFIDIDHVDFERFAGGEPAAISCGDLNINRCGVLMIKAHAVGKAKLAIDDLKAVIRDSVSHTVACVWIE